MAFAGYGLPGRFIRNARPDETCDHCACEEGPEVPATTIIQGETDSFGYETLALCDACNNKLLTEKQDLGTCDHCKKAPATMHTRDPDEGSSGPVYVICRECNGKMMRALNEEAERYERRAL